MKVAIMQPYFLPYIGYFQLIESVDLFIVYDNVKYTKKGWINRNRMLCNGSDLLFSLPLRNAPDASDIGARRLAADFDGSNLLNRMREMYRKAPCFESAFPCIKSMLENADDNLFRFVHQSIIAVCEYLGIETRFVISSEVAIDHGLKGQDKVIALCREVGATTYVNPVGGMELYSRDHFASHGLQLTFLQPRPFVYTQFGQPFVPWLSILDVMMFNDVSTIRRCLELNFDLL